MPAPDFGAWLDQFEQEADAAARRAAPPTSPQARDASAAFERWWKTENEPVLGELTDKDLSLAGETAQRLERLGKERQALEEKAARLERENAALKESEARLTAMVADMQARFHKEKENLEARIVSAENESRAVSNQAANLEQSRQFLQKAFHDAQAEQKTLRADLSLSADRAMAAEREALEARKRASELERQLAALREERAARDGALDELRKQVSVYQQRLIEAKERTDADVALLRQETKMFLEEFRIVANTVKRERA